MDNEKIGKFIKSLRGENKISQHQLADELFVDRTLVNKWEHGACISSNHLLEISKYFKISVDELIMGEKIDSNNKDKIKNITLNLYKENINEKKKTKRFRNIIITLIILTLCFASLFFGFYFTQSFNTTKIYMIACETEDILISQGTVVVTRDRLQFELYNDYLFEADEVEYIRLYYMLDNKRIDVITTDFNEFISFFDYNGRNEYFDSKEMDKIVKKMHIEVEFKDGTFKDYKITARQVYQNDNYFTFLLPKNA